ncbi:hypothetical protein ACIOKD_02845 [Streptomyces sp. NPDC087844]|uniref:hypothetical protein n=1 Tax=Streptomyces sp. NPDC087844 TaxID=3365805 RepID=UPI003806A571
MSDDRLRATTSRGVRQAVSSRSLGLATARLLLSWLARSIAGVAGLRRGAVAAAPGGP